MACVADEICAAPFSFVGSIGVVTYITNVERATKELKLDVYRFTAGKHKRTVDWVGEVTDEDKAKLVSELQVIHDEFKDHVKRHRGAKLLKDIDDVATGEGWLATNALAMGLVDRLITSDQVLMELTKEYDVLVLTEWRSKKENFLLDMVSSHKPPGFCAYFHERMLRWMGSAELESGSMKSKLESDGAHHHRYTMV